MKVGFIGTGNMGNAIIGGIIKSSFVESTDINIYDINTEKCEEIRNMYNVNILEDEKEIVEKSDIIILAVKPHFYSSILSKISNTITNEKIILTIAAGISIAQVQEILGPDKKVIRTMPNTPAQILEGMTAVSFNTNITSKEKEMIFQLLNSFGKAEEIEEKHMHAFTAISGSLPAYVYIFIEALADGGVLEGIPRDKAYKIISQTVQGSAKMVQDTKKHPGQLKDEVTSPGGTTIEALRVLEKHNFRGALIEAVHKCTEKSKDLSKK